MAIQNLGKQGQEVKLIEKGLKRDDIVMDAALVVSTGKGNIVRVYNRENGLQAIMCTLHADQNESCLYRSGGFRNTYRLIEKFEKKHAICLNKVLRTHKPDLIEKLTFDPDAKDSEQNKIDISQIIKKQIGEFLADILTVNDKKKMEEERKQYEIGGKKLDKWIGDLINEENNGALKMIFGEEYELVDNETDVSFYEDFAVAVCTVCHDEKGSNGGCKHRVGVRDTDFGHVKYYEGCESIWCDQSQPKMCYFGDKLGYCMNIGFNTYISMNNVDNLDIDSIEHVKNEMANYIREKEYGGCDPHEILGDVIPKWKHLKVTGNCYYAVLPNESAHIVEIFANVEMAQKLIPSNIFCKLCSKIENVKEIEMGGKRKHNVCLSGYCTNVLNGITTYEAFINVVNQSGQT